MTKNLHIDTQAMRAKILDLAIQGKLTDQRAEDGNAQDLLKEIQAEKEKLIKEKKIKKEKPLPAITEEERPFEIPNSWEWVRLGDICQINPRNHIQDENVNVSFLPMALIGEGYGSNYCPEIRKWKDVKKGFTHFANNDVVLAKISPCFQNLKSAIMNNLINGIGAGTTELHVLRRYSHTLDPKYLLCFVQNQSLIKDGIKTFKGVVGQQRIGKDFIKEYLCPLPPLAEQKRIADKVSTLFAQLDAIDKAYEEYRELQQAMKAKLLELAIQGKLTDQRDEDGDARDLFQDIQEEKQRLIAEKKIKKEKPLPEIKSDEIPFEIPKNWMWVRLGNICSKVVDGAHNPPKGSNHPTPYIMASSQNINNDRLVNLYNVRYLSKEVFEKENLRTLASEGDIFFTSVGSLGRSCVYDGSLNICFQRSVSVITAQIYNWYLKRCFDSPYYQNMMYAEAKGTAQKGFYLKQLSNSLIPLPPLAEQKRIVAKLDELLPLL
ncbi:restriction endonuclease subunit S [Megasphaera elsdenii]|uniref:restriction endonuclease subunit S n=1 Tax=Megasphaera elsdenii TaxID=907 RepID=UPI002A807CDC|nr:restriction endonuclease subunit S [Megasphaera elsdenii]MCI7199661.1 restriction endonuclease subunit S [Megasphaera elsdenii]MDY4265264.1 restriction endonuclease subunit S [Megasphaera elsdenii]